MSEPVPNGWNQFELGAITKQIIDFRGRTPKKLGMEWGDGTIPALSANNVQMGKVNFEKECYLASDELYEKWMTKGCTEKGDILLTMEAPLGNVALVSDDRKYILSQRVILLKLDPNLIDNNFLFQELRSEAFQQQLKENSTGSTALGIQQKRLVKLTVSSPPLPEQQKIASILTSVDEVIEMTEAQISKLQDLKKGMMQELLTNGIGHTEFKDSPVGRIPKEWDVLSLENISDKIWIGLVTTMTKNYVDNGVPLIRNSDIKEFRFKTDSLINLDVDFAKQHENRALREGDIATVHTGDVGTSSVIDADLDGSQGFATLNTRVNKEIVSAEFLCNHFNSVIPPLIMGLKSSHC